jgi:energy-converting hydrogenase Eha subunit A
MKLGFRLLGEGGAGRHRAERSRSPRRAASVARVRRPRSHTFRDVVATAATSLVLGGLLTGLAGSLTAAAAAGTIPSPVAGGWQLNGTAALNTTASPPNLELTPATNWVTGSAFYPTPVAGAGITASFDVFLGSGSGADGMTFTLADASVSKPTALGVTGGGEGFSGITGVAVSFDTWKNTNDPAGNFVGIATTNSPQQQLNYVTTNTSVPSLRNTVHHVVVTTNTTGITVTMDGTQVLTYTMTLPSQVLVGFTAGNGGFNDIHQVQNVSISTGPPPPAPAVTGVSPPSGPSSGGTSVTITGSGFTGATGVQFGGTAATSVTVHSDTSVTATSPAGQAGPVDVTVTAPGGTSPASPPGDQFTYTPPPPPAVTSVSPSSGPSTGGTTVTIAGTNLTGATTVDFGAGHPATFTVTNPATIVATAPAAGALGQVDVTVTTPGGTSTANGGDQYSYVAPPAPTVTAISPASGPAGTSVTITGTGFSGATTVDFGTGSPATFTVSSPTMIVATAPTASTPGVVDVTVTTPGGASPVTGADQFTYQALPPGTIPSPVSGGWQLNGTAVLNTTASPPNLELTPATNWVAGSAFYPTPVAGTGITASFDVFLGSGSGADGMTFTLADASVTKPAALGVNGGGEGFSGITGVAVSFDTWKNSGDPAGNFVGIATTNSAQQSLNYVATNTSVPSLRNTVHHVVVTTNGTGITVTMDGTQILTYAMTLPSQVLVGFTAACGGFDDIHQVQNVSISTGPPPPAPAVTSVSPASGPSTGGTSVTITGSGFTGATGVRFGSTPPTPFTVHSDTSITATSPAGAGAVDVTVASPGGTSAASSADTYTYVSPPPTVVIVNPASGPVGTPVTVSGTNFTGVTAVDFGPGNKASFTVNNSTTLTATAPAGTGTVDVTVTTAAGTSATLTDDQFTYTAGPPPGTIPSPVLGGWQLNGNATLNSTASPPNLDLTPATNWEVGSAFYPTPVASTGITASFDMFIGSGSGADGLTFTLADASATQPTALGDNGGGLGFSGIQGIAVAFDTWKSTVNPSNNFVGIGTYNSEQQQVNYVTTNSSIPALRNTVHHVVVATSPTGISVTMDGTQVLVYSTSLPPEVLVGFTAATGGFNDIHQVQNVAITTGPPPPAPAVTSVSPASGPTTGGTSVTITGSGFAAATGVQFGTVAAKFSAISDTSITATSPAGQVGAVDVTVAGPGGTSATTSADQFTYTPPPAPAVTGVSPASGPSTGGTSVTVTGTNLTGATTVDFGTGNAATFSVSNDTTIVATAPATGSLGPVDVTVTAPGGTSAVSAADQYTYGAAAPPAVTAVSPSAGPGGTSVVITGTGFSGATTVDFGTGNPATFTVSDPATIMATAPASSTLGAVDVTVTTPSGTSAATAADQFTYQAGPVPVTMVATYRGDLARSGYYPAQTGLTAGNVATLKEHWLDATGGTGSYAQPIVVNNLVYWGDWNGVEHATTLSGTDVWTVTTGQNVDNSCLPPVAGISGTATIGQVGTTSVDYFPGGDDNFYAVNALTGALLWKTNLGTPPADYLWGSPILYNGSIYQPVASFGDCPLVQGQLVQMNATTGAIQHIADMAPNGCVGGGIWSSPAVDPSDGSIYVTTGTPRGCSTPGEMAPAIVKLRASDLTVLSSWTVPQSAQQFGDADFGATPTLFTATINGVATSLVGAMNKNGIFYAFDRSNLAAGPVWQSTVADPSGSPRSIASAAWDGTRLYVAAGGTTLNGTSFYGNISALDPATGAFLWRTGVPGFMSGGVTVVPGVLIEGYGAGGNLLFLDPATGNRLRLYPLPSRVDGEVTVSNGIVYVPLQQGDLMALGQ